MAGMPIGLTIDLIGIALCLFNFAVSGGHLGWFSATMFAVSDALQRIN